MVQRLRMENLQSHTDSTIQFHPGVNIVTGPSDVGKSAIIRAMQWVVMNKPSGEALRRHKTKKTTVRLDAVTKIRTASKHQYELNGDTYKALRTDVPEAIKNNLRLSAINFQGQHDAYFLIGESSGQVAKTLNKVADLEIIDLTRQNIKQRVSSAKSNKKFLEAEITNGKKEIKELEWVKKADKEYQEIERLMAEAEVIQTMALATQVQLVEALIHKISTTPSVEEDLKRLRKIDGSLDVDLSLGEVIRRVEEARVPEVFPVGDIGEVNKLITRLTAPDQTEQLKQQIVNAEKASVAIPDTIKDIQKINDFLSAGGTDIEELKMKIVNATDWKHRVDLFPLELDDPTERIEKLQTCASAITTVETVVCELVVAEDCKEEAANKHSQGKVNYAVKLKELGVCPLCEGVL